MTQKRDLGDVSQVVEKEEAEIQSGDDDDDDDDEPRVEEASTSDGESDLEYKEFERPASKEEPLPTMEQERESAVEEEARWVKEHHMEPEEDVMTPPPGEQSSS